MLGTSTIIIVEISESDDVDYLFAPFRGYCARKGLQVQLKEVILDETIDVARTILDYVNANLIGSIVVGACATTKYAIAWKWKTQDVAMAIMKNAPDFCSVYIISKGKVLSVKTAVRSVSNCPFPPKTPFSSNGLHEGGAKNGGIDRLSFESSNDPVIGPSRDRAKSQHSNASLQSLDINHNHNWPKTSTSSSDDSDFSRPIIALDPSINSTSSSPCESTSSHSTRELEAEMRRLRLELKQTMNMYSTACKEALTAKKKAEELNELKLEEARRAEQARIAEESTLAIIEMEKAKCKAAMEAAEKAQKLAEMEAQKRRFAEMKAKKEADAKNRALNALTKNDVRYRKYTIEEIEAATEKFKQSFKIGEGGYGPVYKGRLDHTPVAIKVLRPDAAQGKKQFQQEVEVLSSIRHPHLVLLLGACPEYGCLVYEYLENGSLEDRLLRKDNTPPIPWRKRFDIAAEIATGLLFLHQAKPEPLVHRDLKPANILLDRNYVSKISDVGLARLVPPSVADSVTQYYMTSAAGTFCYIDPEYQQTGKLTTRSDVYSLGIMLLQIVTAKPPMGLAHHVMRAIDKGNFVDMLDQSLIDWPIDQALEFAKLAIKCCELRKKDRPSLASVVVPELNRLRGFGSGQGIIDDM
ncbi:U-box domain-containing protein 34 [Linum perenne]